MMEVTVVAVMVLMMMNTCSTKRGLRQAAKVV